MVVSSNLCTRQQGLLTPVGKLMRGGGAGAVADAMVVGISSEAARWNAMAQNSECEKL